MDNPDPALPGNPDPTVVVAQPVFSWKTQLPADYAGSPSMQKFPDTKEGFTEVAKSYLNLEKLLGNEKVPIPKDANDLAAKAIFNKALGIPDKPEGYALPDIQVPDTMKGLTFDKAKFAEIVHKYELTPTAAKGLWESYTAMNKQAYADALKQREDQMTGIINQMRNEWGPAYQSKVELGQMVINKFSADKETNDFITAAFTQDPRGIKFLAAIGEQFAENKIGDFKYQRHSLTPDEAQAEMDSIRKDPNHPYNNEKSSQAERDRAIDYMNSLIGIVRPQRQAIRP